MLPALFLSHGAPTLPLDDVPARAFLQGIGAAIERRPRAIVVASAHWETEVPTLGAAAQPETIHDFRGFPSALRALRYPAPGAPELAERASDLLCAAGLRSRLDRGRGLDHGAWVPLLLIYPEAGIPVVPLSVQPHLGPAHHLQVGRALAPLRDEGVLVVGSGAFTHDLSRFHGQALDAETPEDVAAFAGWFEQALREERTCDLVTYRARAPYAAEQHPTEEHLLPLFVAMGASGADATHPLRARHLHASAMHGVLRMDAWAFG
jgi:4,5-DOPA dioxygenase extradiol